MDKEGIIIGILGILFGLFGLIYSYRERNIKTNEDWRLIFIVLASIIAIPFSVYLLWKSIG
jgi:cell shape-determining protein MreD